MEKRGNVKKQGSWRIVAAALAMTVMAVVSTVSDFTAFPAFAAEKPSPARQGGAVIHPQEKMKWQETANGWVCVYEKTGESFSDEWALVDEGQKIWYYFDENGIMQTGWLDYEGDRFYLGSDGRLNQTEGPREIDGETYLFTRHGDVWRSQTRTYDGVAYTVDENGKVVGSGIDKAKENPPVEMPKSQVDYLNTRRKEKGISLLSEDGDLNRIAQKAYALAKSNGDQITLYEVSLLASQSGYPYDHIAYIYASAIGSGYSSIYLTGEAWDLLENTWYTRAGYYREGTDIMIILAAKPGESAAKAPVDQVQGRWVADGSSWKYQRADDTFAVSCWVQTPNDGKWYHFDENGYMQKDWFQDSDGKWYYLNPDNGDMVTDRMIGEYYVGPDGVWIQ